MIQHRPALSRRTLLGTGLAAPIALAAGCSDDPEPDTAGGPPDQVTYLTNFGQLGRDSYAWLALDRGHFADANLEVSIEPGAGTNPNLQALLSGQAQFAAVDMAGAAIARVEQDGFVAIGAIHQRPLAAVVAYADSGIRQPYDLAGRTVGLAAGAVTELLFSTYLDIAPLVEPDEVEQVLLEPAALVPALASGQVDAIGQFVVGRPLIEAAGEGREAVVFPYDEYLDDLYGVCLFTTVELAAQQPQLCQRFRDALLAGLRDAMDDPEEAGRSLVGHHPEVSPEVAAAEMELMTPYCRVNEAGVPLGHIDQTRLARHIALLSAVGLLGFNPNMVPEDLADADMVPGGEQQ